MLILCAGILRRKGGCNMKTGKKLISVLIAIFMILALFPAGLQEANAADDAEQVNMFDGVIYAGKTAECDLSQYDSSGIRYMYFHSKSIIGDIDIFDHTGSKFSWKVPYNKGVNNFLVGTEGYFEIFFNDFRKYVSERIVIKQDISGADFSKYFPDLTYTGKPVKHDKFYVAINGDLAKVNYQEEDGQFVNGTIDFRDLRYKKDFTVHYSNNIKVGKAVITLKSIKGDLVGTARATFNIRPKGTTAKAPKRGRKSFTARWAKQKTKMPKARITGYQVQYSTDKKFKKGVRNKYVKGYKKTSKKIKGLRKNTVYYVRVRTYMKVGGKNYYSTWSKVKAVKTK